MPKASAILPGQPDGEPIAIHANHTDMVRFTSVEDPYYVKVSEILCIMAKGAGNHIRSNWETERRIAKGEKLKSIIFILNTSPDKLYDRLAQTQNKDPEAKCKPSLYKDLQHLY